MADCAQSETIGRIAAATCGRAFLVGLDKSALGKPRLTVHRFRDPEIPSQAAALKQNLRMQGINAAVRERTHGWNQLERTRALEHLANRFAHDRIVADPTGFYARTTALVDFARALRERIGGRVEGIYWNSDWRVVYVVFGQSPFIREGHVRRADLALAEETVLERLEAACGHLAPDFFPAVRLGFELPEVAVTPVDCASIGNTAGAMVVLRRYAGIPALGALLGFGLAGAASAGEQAYGAPAVSSANGKIGIAGGFEDQDNVNDAGTGRLIGSYTMPLGQRFGLQIDGMLGVNDDDFTGGAGGHLFWRDPSRALLGLTIGYAEVDRSRTNGFDKDITQVGGEGELYLGDITLSGGAGGQWGTRIDDGVYARADIHWYVSENLMLSAGAQYDEEREGLARFGLEYQVPSSSMHGMTVFADGRFGDQDYAHVRAGLRFYFGGSSSLKHRHRYDDPVTNTADYAADSLTGDPESMIIIPPDTPPPPSQSSGD